MITITQQPTTPNLVVGPNVWVLSGLGNANRYVLQLWVDSVAVATFKQTPNPAGVGIFSIGEVLQSYMSSNALEELAFSNPTPGAAIRYRVRYGSETGSTITWQAFSSFVIAHNGYKPVWERDWVDRTDYLSTGTPGDCGQEKLDNVTLVLPLTTQPGVREYSEGQFKEFIADKPVLLSDWATLSFLNYHSTSFTSSSSGLNKSPWSVIIRYYNSSGTEYAIRAYTLSALSGMPVRPTCDSTGWLMTDPLLVGTIGTGPQNLKSAGLWPTTDPVYYKVEVRSALCNPVCNTIASIVQSSGPIWVQKSYTLVDPCTRFTPVQMSFMNSFGVRDYWTWTKRNTLQETTEAREFSRDLGTWSSTTWSANPWDRGASIATQSLVTQMTLSTDWITEDESLWLEELFTSPECKIYWDGEWRSVIIKTRTYDEKTDAREVRPIRYTITV